MSGTLLYTDSGISHSLNVRPSANQVIYNAKSARNAGWTDMISIVPQETGSLYGFVTLATTTILLYDDQGNLLATRNNLVIGEISTVVKNQTYYLSVTSSILTAADAAIFTVQLYVTPKISDYFEGGFFTVQPFIPGITSSTNSNGVLTYNFTAVPLTLNQTTGLYLGYSGIAYKTGTYTITSSDTSVFPNVSDGFVPNVSFQFQFQSLKTIIFTGTITISVTGAGVLGPVSTIPVGLIVRSDQQLFNKSIKRKTTRNIMHIEDSSKIDNVEPENKELKSMDE